MAYTISSHKHLHYTINAVFFDTLVTNITIEPRIEKSVSEGDEVFCFSNSPDAKRPEGFLVAKVMPV